MATIGSLTVDLALKTAAFLNDLNKTSQQVAKNTTVMRRSVEGLAVAFGGLFSARLIRQIVAVQTESLKLAASMHGPLADAAQKFLSQFEELQDTFKLAAAQGFLDGLNGSLITSQQNIKEAAEAGKVFGETMASVAKDAGQFFGKDLPGFIEDVKSKWGEAQTAASEYALTLQQIKDLNSDIVFSHGESSFAKTIPGKDAVPGVIAYGTALELAAMEQESFWSATVSTTAAGEIWLEQINNNTKALDALATPAEKYITALETIERLHLSGEAASRAHTAATATLMGSYLDLADNVGTALGTVFKDSKGVAIAQAVINTAQAITKTFAEYGATPWGFALAASMAAIGAAQIAAIVSAQPGSTKSPAIRGGRSNATAAAGASSKSTAGGGLSQVVTIKIEGDVFGPEHFRRIVEGINGVQRDGTALLRVA